MVATTKFAGKGCAVSLFLIATLTFAQQPQFGGTWQMDPAKSKLNDGRTVTLMFVSTDTSIKMTMKTHKINGSETISEFASKLDGKPVEFMEGDHKSQLIVWFNGPALNASKEGGPASDVTSGWKFEVAPDKQSMTMTITHYDPAAADETLVFTKKPT